MLGIFVGIAAVVSLISLGQGMNDFMEEMFAQMGSDIIMVMPGSGFESFGSLKLAESDEKIIMNVRGVQLTAPFMVKIAKINYRKETAYTFVTCMPVDERYQVLDDMGQIEVVEGRRPDVNDKYKVALGYLFGKGEVFENQKLRVGDKIDIDDQSFKVVGLMGSMGNDQDDRTVYAPVETCQEMFNDKSYDQILVKVKKGSDPAVVAEEIKDKMRKDRGQEIGEEDFNVQTSEQLLDSIGGMLVTIQTVVVGISGISLIVGGIGILNAMYTSVLERTQEIGVMKAIGARNRDIMEIFLVESGMIGIIGGLVGAAMGIMMSKTVEYYSVNVLNQELLKASMSPYLIFGALAFSFIVGCISGVLPAIQASKLKPVDALRYE